MSFLNLFGKKKRASDDHSLDWLFEDDDDDEDEDDDDADPFDDDDFMPYPSELMDDGGEFDAEDAAYVWMSSGKDEDYMFGYSEDELEGAL